MSRPSLSLAPGNVGRPSLVVTEVKGRPPLTLDSVTPGAANVSRSPRTEEGRAKCGQIPERFAKCSVLQGDSVEPREDRKHVIKCMDVQEFETHSLCDRLPHVVPILDVKESTPLGKRWWVKMNFYPNGDIVQYIEESDTPPVDLVYKWAQQIAIGLDGIHRKGVIHRDIKPDNIFLDANLGAYIADFGRAYTDGKNIDIDYELEAPTPNYGRPQAEVSTYTAKEDDWWSFGVLVFNMLTGYEFDLPKLDKDGNLCVMKGWKMVQLKSWLDDSFENSSDNRYIALTNVVYSAMHYDSESGKCNIKSKMEIDKILTQLNLNRSRSSSRKRSRSSSRTSSRKRSRSSRTKKKRKRNSSSGKESLRKRSTASFS